MVLRDLGVKLVGIYKHDQPRVRLEYRYQYRDDRSLRLLDSTALITGSAIYC